MPLVPTTSPATALPVPPSYIHTTAFSFVDTAGRTLLLRGVNLSGASKAPFDRPSHVLDDFWESAGAEDEVDRISFVGRPLRLDDGSADVHLARLRGWGFNLLRFPFTWEALEHEGPGKYDYEFMDYLIQVLCKCRDYGFRVYMDPHQDTWSRFSGGSGAPYWTLPACAINPRNITATQAAILHSEYPSTASPDPASLPAMVWSTNYGRLLSQTVFTLFFAGADLAPNCILDGVNIQSYLQSHFIEACGKLADRIRQYDAGSLFDECIIGWDSMNEPFEGLCGWEDVSHNPEKQGSTLKKGTYPTPAQSFRLGMGQPQTVDHWKFGRMGPKKDGSVTIDPKGRKLWADPGDPTGELPDGTHPRYGWKRDVSKWPLGTCIWAQHGVWDVQTGFILRPDYFRYNPSSGLEIEFLSEYWKPHWLAYASRIRRAHPEAIVFVQPPVFAIPPRFSEGEVSGRCAYSPHYYDGLTLITRHWNWFNADALGLLRGKYGNPLAAVKFGEKDIRKSLYEQMGYLMDDVGNIGRGCYPMVIGEIGTPLDMDGKRSYGWGKGGKGKGDYSNQEKALDASLSACDAQKSNAKTKRTYAQWRCFSARLRKFVFSDTEDTEKPKTKVEKDDDVQTKGDSLNWTVWTYVPDDHSHEWGDAWNLEDLSLFSVDDVVYEGEEPSRGRGRLASGEEEEMREFDLEEGGDDTPVLDDDALNSRAGLLASPPSLGENKGRSKGLFGRWKKNTNLGVDLDGKPAPMLSGVTLATLEGNELGDSAKIDVQPRTVRRKASDLSISSSESSSSSLSCGTLPVPTSPYRKSQSRRTHHHSHPTLGHSPNPYTLLTNGARAVRAFARPWPLKVVGRAVEVKFDVSIGVFKCVVSVGWDDGVERGGQRMATEIYIPMVHYAHERILEDALERRAGVPTSSGFSTAVKPGEEEGNLRKRNNVMPITKISNVLDNVSSSLSTSASSNGNARVEYPPHSISGRQDRTVGNVGDDFDYLSTASTSFNTPDMGFRKYEYEEEAANVPPPMAPSHKLHTPGQAPLLIADTYLGHPLVDLEVKVSGGQYAVRGQTLFWWYDVPAAHCASGSSSRQAEGGIQEEEVESRSEEAVNHDEEKAASQRVEYTIEIKRRGGVLKPVPVPRMAEDAKRELERLVKDRERRGTRDGRAALEGASEVILAYWREFWNRFGLC